MTPWAKEKYTFVRSFEKSKTRYTPCFADFATFLSMMVIHGVFVIRPNPTEPFILYVSSGKNSTSFEGISVFIISLHLGGRLLSPFPMFDRFHYLP